MVKPKNEALELFREMKSGIDKAGGTFCQYRACNLNVDTIYDLENIKNGVVFARSPLCMNDPFDSMIGFSTEKLYQDFCNMIVSIIPDQMTKVFMGILLKERAVGKVAEFISTIKAFQAFLRVQKMKMNPTGPSISAFAISQRNALFKKMPPVLKKKIGNTQAFSAVALFTADVDLSMITEENLLQMFRVDSALTALLDKFEEVKEKHYIPQFREFLSKITVSCFSASGWNNQLMWSHYANEKIIKEYTSWISVEALFFKDKCFEDEREIRYVAIVPNSKLKELYYEYKGKKYKMYDFRIVNGMLIPYIKMPFNNWNQKECWAINSIRIGPSGNADQKVAGLKQFIQSLDYELAECDVMKSNIPVRY